MSAPIDSKLPIPAPKPVEVGKAKLPPKPEHKPEAPPLFWNKAPPTPEAKPKAPPQFWNKPPPTPGRKPEVPESWGGIEPKESFKAKVTRLALNEAADSHTFGTSFGLGVFHGTFKLIEQVALPGTDSHRSLVEADRRRNEHQQSNPDDVWVKTAVITGVSAGLPMGMAAFGFDTNAQVTSVFAHHVDSKSDVLKAIGKQTVSMVLPASADELANLKAAPGSEWSVRGYAGISAGIGPARRGMVEIGPASVVAEVGASVNATDSQLFVKTVKVLDDTGKVHIQVARESTDLALASVGLDMRATLGSMGLDQNHNLARAGVGVRNVNNKKLTRLVAAIYASHAVSQKVMASSVLDLSKAEDRAVYDTIMRATPGDAIAYIKDNKLGPDYSEQATVDGRNVNFQAASADFLTSATVHESRRGVLFDGKAKTSLAQELFGRTVSGLIPRLALGEERNVEVRAGTVTHEDGKVEKAVALDLSVKDTKFTLEEAAQLGRFAQAMGSPVGDIENMKGKAKYQVSVALSDAEITKLGSWDADGVLLGLASAYRTIEGTGTLPPWFANPSSFEHYRAMFQRAGLPMSTPRNSGLNDSEEKVVESYAEAFPGRDLRKDVASARAANLLVKEVMSARGKPVTEWEDVLSAVGKQKSLDVRAALLALHRLTGAYVVDLEVTVNHQTLTGESQGPAQKSLKETVDGVMGPPA